MHGHLPGGEAPGGDELELARAFQTWEKRRPVAGEDKVDDQLVLVERPSFSSWVATDGLPSITSPAVFAFSATMASRSSPRTWGKSRRERETTYLRFFSSFCAQSGWSAGAFSSGHPRPVDFHHLVGDTPEEHGLGPVHEAGEVLVQLGVSDPLAVVDTAVQRDVDGERQLAHGWRF